MNDENLKAHALKIAKDAAQILNLLPEDVKVTSFRQHQYEALGEETIRLRLRLGEKSSIEIEITRPLESA